MRDLLTMKQAAFLLLFLLTAMANLSGQNPAPGQSPQAIATASFNGKVEEFFDHYFHFHPTEGTYVGLHQYDTLLEDFSQKSRDAELAFLLEAKQGAGYANPEFLNEEQRIDLKLIASSINARILELQEIRMWQKNPDVYSSTGTAGVYLLRSRNFAALEERLKSVIAREQQIPKNLADAKSNLKNPPRVYTEIALEQLPGIISFFQNDVPAAFTDAKDAGVKADFAKSNAAVIAALQGYEQWLKSDLLARSNGDFRFGADTFSRKLLYDEMVDTPLDRLL